MSDTTCAECESTIPEDSRRYKFCSDKCKNRFHAKKSYHRNKSLKGPAHPNIKEDYFKTIDTKEKAYWLGFLCADGHVNKKETRLQLHLSAKDDDQIDRFIEAVNANPKKKRYYGPYETSGKSVQIGISNEKFVSHLVNHGCSPVKTNELSLPRLEDDCLNLAFLMGFFDGDGKENGCELFSSNRKLLDQIKSHYSISSPIVVQPTTYALNLGSELFLKMLQNYSQSMTRKRRLHPTGVLYGPDMNKKADNHCVGCDIPITLSANRCKSCAAKKIQSRKFDPSREDLKRLVWEMPASKVGDHFGVTGRSIKKRCDKLGIETPGRGYWAKKRAGKT